MSYERVWARPGVGARAPPYPTVVQYPHGRYELRGDGIQMPYQWVWIPNPPLPPPPPAAAPAPPPAPPPYLATQSAPPSRSPTSAARRGGLRGGNPRARC